MTDTTARDERHGDMLAVVSQSGPTVTFFDAAADSVVDTLELLAEPHELCFDPTQRLLWCTNTYFGGYYHANQGRRTQLTVIDPDTRAIVEVVDLAPEHGPHGLALDAARNRLYVSVEGSDDRSGGVVVVDTLTRKPLGRIDTGAPGPHWFVIDPAGAYGYASNKEAPIVSVVDLADGTLTATVEVPGSEGLAVSADGREVYVAAPYGSFARRSLERPLPGIRVIDTASRTIVDVLPTENVVFPVHLACTGVLLTGELRMEVDGNSALGRQAPGRLNAFCTENRMRVAQVELTGRFPLTITSSPDGRLAYVAGVSSSTVDIVDTESWQLLASLDIAKHGEPGAHGLAYIPRRS